MPHTIVIAEIGECFNGDMDTAKKLIEAAHAAECDIAKFQTLDYDNISDDDPERDWFLKISLGPKQIAELTEHGKKTGIAVLFTPENVKTAQWLLDAGHTDIKIASSTAADPELLDFIGANFRRVFVSTGMASLDEVDGAVDRLSAVDELYILHCVSEYPTGPLLAERGLRALAEKDVRLNMMRILMERYPRHRVGYSDHTEGILAPVAAAAMGATVVEKHITLDRKTPIENFNTGGEYMGTDHVLSVEPPELGKMVSQIRRIESMRGPEGWERSPGEKVLMEFLRGRFAGDDA